MEITDKVGVTLKEFEIKDTFDKLVNGYKKTKYYKDNYVWTNLILYVIRDGIDYLSLFIEDFNERIKNMGDLNADDFNKIWDMTFDIFKEKYNLESL